MKQKQVLEVIYNGKGVKVKRLFFTNILRKIFHTNRKHKDRLFIHLFRDKKLLLDLYNAVNHSYYKNPDELEITTMEDAVYLGMKNDCSFLIGNYMNLYEHQSTFNPNMPLRGFLYFSGLIQAHLALAEDNDIYGIKMVKIPTPRYIVFYNGSTEYPDEMVQKLSDSFEGQNGCMEFTALMLNINQGHNEELMNQCKALREYSIFIEQIRIHKRAGLTYEEAIDAACEYCIEHNVLKEFLLKNRNEVMQLILTEYDEKKHLSVVAKNAREEGREEGLEEGLEKGLEKGEFKKVIEQIKKKLDKGLNAITIAEHLEEPVKEVEKIVIAIRENPSASEDELWEKLK